MTQIQFGEADRQRWGLPEWMPVHPYSISMDDLEELSERFGFDDPSVWPEQIFGDIPLEQAGQPDARPVRPKWAVRAWAWMGLRQNGHMVSWDELGTVQFGWIRLRSDEEPGKDPAPSPSPPSEASTTEPSESSST